MGQPGLAGLEAGQASQDLLAAAGRPTPTPDPLSARSAPAAPRPPRSGGPQASARPLVTSWRKSVAGAWWPRPGGGLGGLQGTT